MSDEAEHEAESDAGDAAGRHRHDDGEASRKDQERRHGLAAEGGSPSEAGGAEQAPAQHKAQKRVAWDQVDRNPHTIHICMTLKRKSKPFNADQDMELTFRIPECGEFKGGGTFNAIIDPKDEGKWMVGDFYNLKISKP
jgi:hypothetical protein